MKNYRNYIFIPISLILLMNTSVAWSAAYIRANLKFSASIFEPGCIVSADSQNLIVNLGTRATKDFIRPNSTSAAQYFLISLEDCTASTVTIGFKGVPSNDNSSYLALDNTSTAQNVAIQLLNNDRSPLNLNTDSLPATVNSTGQVNFGLYARYISQNGGVTAGTANATATFYLKYD